MGSVNNRLRYYRRLKDLTQDELGVALEVTRQTILALEKRKYEPSIALALRIASFFGVSVEEMFFFDEGGEDDQCSD